MSGKIILQIMKIILLIVKIILRIVKIILRIVMHETGYVERSCKSQSNFFCPRISRIYTNVPVWVINGDLVGRTNFH